MFTFVCAQAVQMQLISFLFLKLISIFSLSWTHSFPENAAYYCFLHQQKDTASCHPRKRLKPWTTCITNLCFQKSPSKWRTSTNRRHCYTLLANNIYELDKLQNTTDWSKYCICNQNIILLYLPPDIPIL